LVNYILQIENEEILIELKSIVNGEVVINSINGKGLTKKDYLLELESAEKQINDGKYIDHDVVKKEISQG